MKIQYIAGDATKPIEMTPHKIIAHIVNNRCGWGRGFVLALSSRWPVDLKEKSPEFMYRRFCDTNDLGDIQMVDTPDGIKVCNMYAQKDFRKLTHQSSFLPSSVNELGLPNLSYSSLYECLLRLRIECETAKPKYSIHMPPIGSGLAGGDWKKIEGIINQVFENTPFPVLVYRREGMALPA